MKRESVVHWELPRIPENEFLFKPRHEEVEGRHEENSAEATNATVTEDAAGQ